MDGASVPVLDTGVPALVLKVGDYVNHHGGVAVVRTLGRLGVPVYGVHEDRLAPAGLSRYATGRFVWPTAGEDAYQSQLLEGIETVAERIRSPAVLIPTDDHAAMFVADHADVLRRWFLFPHVPAELVRAVVNKGALYQRCAELGEPVPTTTMVTTPQDVESLATSATFPVVAKRSAPRLLATGLRARSTQVVRSPQELLSLDLSSPMLLQEHIPVEHSEDWLFHGYCDRRSECLVAFTGRKMRSYPPGAGETALGKSAENPVLEEQASSLFRRLGYQGVMSLDYRYDRRDGRYKLLDFNPRTGAIFRLFQTAAGVDVVRAMHLDLTGRKVPSAPPIAGRVVVVEGYDARACTAGLRTGALRPRDCVSAWRAVHETAWFAPDDVLPAAVALVRATVNAVRGRRARLAPARPAYVRGRAAARRSKG